MHTTIKPGNTSHLPVRSGGVYLAHGNTRLGFATVGPMRPEHADFESFYGDLPSGEAVTFATFPTKIEAAACCVRARREARQATRG